MPPSIQVRRRIDRWWPGVWPGAVGIVTTVELTHTQAHLLLLAASAFIVARLSSTPLASRGAHRTGWVLVALGQAGEAMGAGLDRRELAVAEMVHVGGQLISMVAVVLFLGAGAVALLSVRRSPLHPIASLLLFVAAAVGSIGLQVELPLAVVLLPPLTWSVIAAWLVGAPVVSATSPNPRPHPASSDAERCAAPG